MSWKLNSLRNEEIIPSIRSVWGQMMNTRKCEFKKKNQTEIVLDFGWETNKIGSITNYTASHIK